MKAQNMASGGSDAGMMSSFNQAVLKVSPTHPIAHDLERMLASQTKECNDNEAKNFAVLSYDVVALTSGYEIEDSGNFTQRILSTMTSKAKSDVQDVEVEVSNNVVVESLW